MRRLKPQTLLVAGLLAALTGCTDTLVESLAKERTNVDDKLSLTGRVCTSSPDSNGFPVKVVLVVDQSGSMCVSDPPGSQEASGFCERAEVAAIVPPGVTEPSRVRALRRLVGQFRAQPNVQVAIVPFETNIRDTWPGDTGNRFARPTSTSGIDTYIGGLQAQLGKGTDYQGALAEAYKIVSGDITDVAKTRPAELPRTRYVVVFLTDGTPYPRCSANDSLTQYASPDQPDLTWEDSSSAREFCNLMDPEDPDAITGYIAGTDRNQNYQLFSLVKRLVELKEANNVGDIRMHTVLLFNEEAVRACGAICQDLYGTYPGVDAAQYPREAKKISSWLLKRFAEMGGGVYQEFNNMTEISQLGLGALDYSSFASRNVLKTLMVEALTAKPAEDSREPDSDGDGVPDRLDNSFSLGTNPYLEDSDGDCFSDGFESLRADQGFTAANSKDARGCDPASPLTPGCRCADTDGDGLSQYAEDYLRTHSGLVDSDGDGLPDLMEARYGLDPRKFNATGIDTDGDGIPDDQELRAESNPTRRDRSFYDRFGYQYEVKAEVQANGRVCYDFTVSNLRLVTPPSRSGVQQGYNLFKVWFAQSPESGVSTDYGEWRTACAWAQYAPPGVRVPLGPELTLEDGNFVEPYRLDTDSDYRGRCVGVRP